MSFSLLFAIYRDTGDEKWEKYLNNLTLDIHFRIWIYFYRLLYSEFMLPVKVLLEQQHIFQSI